MSPALGSEAGFHHVGGGDSFALPPTLEGKLPEPGPDGLVRIDVRVKGKWDGILVVNAEKRCIGLLDAGTVAEENLPFLPEDIEDVRPACLWNRFLSQLWVQLAVVLFPYASVVLTFLLTAAHRPLGIAAPLAAIVIGLLGQYVVMKNIRPAYCVTGIPLLLAILGGQVTAVVVLIKRVAG